MPRRYANDLPVASRVAQRAHDDRADGRGTAVDSQTADVDRKRATR